MKKNYGQSAFVVVLFTTILFGSSLLSCKTAKKIQTAIVKKDSPTVVINQTEIDSAQQVKKTLDSLHSRYIDFNTFSAKIKVEYEDSKGKQPNVTAYVHILKDSVIWVSMYATVFNIEALRVLITKDSVFVLNKIEKEATLRSMDYLQEVTNIPFDFKTLQDLLVGNPVFLDNKNIVSYKKTAENKILIATIGKYFKNLITLNNSDEALLLHSKLDDVDINENRTADITYDAYENKIGFNFSTYREVTVSEKNKIDVRLNYKQYEFNKDVSVAFNIPQNYTRK
ncbi:DUF4292 domain-containing protein [Ferruginibacter albus]|uniref:DUF4292 domain-containing protein n=1 Tax=Ferruginibacter albus TaxID=2875540 RepID=UPI001CC4EBD9|nr:DUF4292 domain-containing protein [Ferruginibacter albus]UAY51413.1 DUF4292 domain-containing protein [Ferruginibacter albus]